VSLTRSVEPRLHNKVIHGICIDDMRQARSIKIAGFGVHGYVAQINVRLDGCKAYITKPTVALLRRIP